MRGFFVQVFLVACLIAAAYACVSGGGKCYRDWECCSKKCDATAPYPIIDSKCSGSDTASCTPSGRQCQGNGDCCSGNCKANSFGGPSRCS